MGQYGQPPLVTTGLLVISATLCYLHILLSDCLSIASWYCINVDAWIDVGCDKEATCSSLKLCLTLCLSLYLCHTVDGTSMNEECEAVKTTL